MKTTLKKIGAIAVIGGLFFGLAAYMQVTNTATVNLLTTSYDKTVDSLNTKVTDLTTKVEAGELVQAKLDLAQEDLKAAKEQAERDALVLADVREILADLEKETVSPSPSTTEDLEVEDDLALNSVLGPVEYDNNDLRFLIDDEIEHDDEDYDVQERIILTNDVKITTSLEGDEDLLATPALIFADEEAIQYLYVFDDPIDYSLISDDEELVLEMVGMEYVIIDADANSITVVEGTEYALKEGESVLHNGKTLELLTVAEDKVFLRVDGQSIVIDEDDSKTVSELDIRVDEVLYTGKETSQSWVSLTVSVDAERVIDNGDEYVDGDDRFEWRINTAGGDLLSIGIVLAEEASDADEAILRPGETLDFAGLFEVGFDYDGQYEYFEYEVSLDEVTSANLLAVRIDSRDGDNIVIGDEDVDEAYILANGTVVYKDDDNDWTLTTDALVLENDDLSYTVSVNGTHVLVGPLALDLSTSWEYFGTLDEEAETTDLIVGTKTLGTRDDDVLLSDGTIIESPENSLDNDELVLRLPNDKVEMLVTVGR